MVYLGVFLVYFDLFYFCFLFLIFVLEFDFMC